MLVALSLSVACYLCLSTISVCRAIFVCRFIVGFFSCIMGGVTPAATGVCVAVALSSSGSVTDVGPSSGSLVCPSVSPLLGLVLFSSLCLLSCHSGRCPTVYSAAPTLLLPTFRTQLCMACAGCSPPCPSLTHITVGCGLVAPSGCIWLLRSLQLPHIGPRIF